MLYTFSAAACDPSTVNMIADASMDDRGFPAAVAAVQDFKLISLSSDMVVEQRLIHGLIVSN